jgi:hypothetical protein
MAIMYGRDWWSDDPSPEDLQKAFRDEQAHKTADFRDALTQKYPAMHNGTPNEPERELSAADVHAMLQQITTALTMVMAHLETSNRVRGHDVTASIFADLNMELRPYRDRLADAPPY